jgi:S-adenosylmethionine decarboxylase proenzyme
LLLELRGCDPAALNDLPFVRQTLIEAAERVGATIIGHSFHQFSPQGVTGVVAIAESHLCIHTWPEHGYAAVDVFTCGDSFHPEIAADYIVARLRAADPTVISLKRGILPLRVPVQPELVALRHG